MNNSNETIVHRLDNRDGFTVVDYREVGLPVFSRDSLLTLQEISEIGPIEQFVLKSIKIGLTSPQNIQKLLGLSQNIIDKQIGSLVYDGAISSAGSSDNDEFSLTQSGRERLALARTAIVSKETIPIYVDGITRTVIPIDSNALYTAKQLEDEGISLISPVPRHPPKESEIDIGDINTLFEITSGSRTVTKRVLKLEGFIGRNRMFFQRAIAIAYKSANARNMVIGFAIDGRISDDHEEKYGRAKDGPRSKLFGMLFDPKKRRKDIRDVARHVKDILPTVDSEVNTKRSGGKRKTISLKGPRNDTPVNSSTPSLVKPLQVYDHPPLLAKALESATHRILIISPWIRAGVVDASFISQLSECLNRGVNVRIEYGIGRVDKDEKYRDKSARSALEGLSQSFSNFSLTRTGNTHAKVLLVDDKYFVTTSFNWLSFRGDPTQPFREEWGTYVEGTEIVNAYYATLTETKPT